MKDGVWLATQVRHSSSTPTRVFIYSSPKQKTYRSNGLRHDHSWRRRTAGKPITTTTIMNTLYNQTHK